jgi:hypothetical protein
LDPGPGINIPDTGWRLLLGLESLSRGLYDKYIVIFVYLALKFVTSGP